MKKVLFASVAAVAFSAAAAQAAEPVKLSIGGYATQWAGYASNKDNSDLDGTAGVTAADKRTNFDVQDDVRINFTGATKLDNGIAVSVEVDTYASQGTNSHTNTAGNRNVQKSFTAITTAYGTVELGEQDNVGALIHVSSPDVGGIGGQDGNWMNWVISPTNNNETLQRTYAGDDRSNNKIIYVTPSWNGLVAGFSYTPNIQQNSTSGAGHTTIPSSVDYNGALSGDLYVYGVGYTGTFGDVSVKADLGSGNANVGNLHVYQGGLNVSYKGFTVGGSYLKRDIDADINTANTKLGNGTLISGYGLAGAAHVGDSWDAGASYVTGPYGVSLTYFQGESLNGTQSLAANSKKYDKDYVWTLAGAYDLGPGVKLTESVFYVDYKNASGLEADKNNGWGAVTGVNIAF